MVLSGGVLPAANAAGARGPTPEITRRVLSNGLVLLVSEKHKLPVVSIRAMVRAGSLYEPAERAGLANLTAQLLTRGTRTRTATGIAEEIDFLGGSLESSCQYDAATVTVRALGKDFDTAMELLADVLRNPSFSEDEIQRKKQEISSEIRTEDDDPSVVLRKAFGALVFADHPYGRPVNGTEGTITAIKREDIRSFYRRCYAPQQVIIAIAGDVRTPRVIKRVEELFGGWARARETLPVPVLPVRAEVNTLRIVDREVSQAYISLGHVGISRRDPDYYPVRVMAYILGSGGFASRLMQNVRSAQGLAYDVYAYFEPRMQPGVFEAGLQTKCESAETAIKSMLAEINRMREEEVSDKELADAKAYYIGSFPLQLETNSELTQMLVAMEFHGLGIDYIRQYPRRVEAITKRDILRVARRYLDPQHCALVLVTDRARTPLNLPSFKAIE
jgi:zinc protease